MAEMRQLFKDLQALLPVHQSDIHKNANLLSSHTFVVDKFMVDGSYDKTKARVVSQLLCKPQ